MQFSEFQSCCRSPIWSPSNCKFVTSKKINVAFSSKREQGFVELGFGNFNLGGIEISPKLVQSWVPHDHIQGANLIIFVEASGSGSSSVVALGI